ncbi:hypothetical protein COY32_03380 [candidate division WWE3 bacterium CG_4_10_14_0_2_um_filter_41_14]|uniref:Vitamin K epoxide reductase domain-containing protein n=1 Tax=candidate division WWE3 bacterium CG_4_10_14_0_2_um_filter_41_14 TaxID=1975072 RepID=A0A2M7TIZ3_UNCKA|nr:MAG: hypothetical protein COY32_03380 [candidate division WWE3 bacterium CG_4_10_14_0_2_um_filter_41_14]
MKKLKINTIVIAFLVISFIGFLDATYLTVSHYRGTELNCTILQGCEEVTNSAYSVIYGVPVALLGMGYYLVIMTLSLFLLEMVLSMVFLETHESKILKILPYLTIFGFVASIWFVYLQIFVIGEICEYCMLSATTSTLLFILGIILLTKQKHARKS